VAHEKNFSHIYHEFVYRRRPCTISIIQWIDSTHVTGVILSTGCGNHWHSVCTPACLIIQCSFHPSRTALALLVVKAQ
jgi:hypothetical protein